MFSLEEKQILRSAQDDSTGIAITVIHTESVIQKVRRAAITTMPENSIADILAIAAHRDDVEQTCGGTLLKMKALGWRTAILDLTQGEAGTRGSAAERAAEASYAARILRAVWRQALDIPDGRVENTYENRVKIVRALREVRPRVVILPYWTGRHPDHYTTSMLGYEACFLSGLAKLDTGAPPHRPFKILYASLYADVRPSFVIDITPYIEQRHQALMAYKSQYQNQSAGSSLFVPEEEIRERTFAEARHYGLLGGVRYAEPFVQKEVGLVEDVMRIPVQSM
jgi:bacillithiol biosynthesis deacetylase BshB1